MAFDSKWAHDEDRCYHGIHEGEGTYRILVEQSTYGPTQRRSAKVLRELQPIDPVVTFNWGYTGSGPNAAARVILLDAFGWEPPTKFRHAFVWDWIGMAADEFWFRRSAILRWARGWSCDHGVHDLRAPLAELPPVDPGDYAISPELRAELERRRT
jgi:hypothetical protein